MCKGSAAGRGGGVRKEGQTDSLQPLTIGHLRFTKCNRKYIETALETPEIEGWQTLQPKSMLLNGFQGLQKASKLHTQCLLTCAVHSTPNLSPKFAWLSKQHISLVLTLT